LPSRLGAHNPLVNEVLELMEQLGWGTSELFGIHMALEESLTNAIRHGNKFDDSKVVQVECRLSPERFWLQVRDEGEGFIPECVPDCTSAERIEVPGGRGLMLIRAYMNDVCYTETGKCITMEKIRGQEVVLEDD
jgi:serine/threonine-protein kinase RsbW